MIMFICTVIVIIGIMDNMTNHYINNFQKTFPPNINRLLPEKRDLFPAALSP